MKRAYLIYGPDRILVEESINAIRSKLNPGDLDYSMLFKPETKDRDIWALANQYPIDPVNHRLVIVRNADLIKDWKPLEEWLASRFIPQNHVLFVFNAHALDEEIQGNAKREIPPAPWYERIVKTGRTVHCHISEVRGERGGPSPKELWLADRAGLESGASRRILERLRGDLTLAVDVANKMALLGTNSEQVAMLLTEPAPATQFVDDLAAMKKKDALAAIELVPDDEYPLVFSWLERRLDHMQTFYVEGLRRIPEKQTAERLGQTPGEKHILRELSVHARYYDPKTTFKRLVAITQADRWWRAGAEVGVLESLVAGW